MPSKENRLLPSDRKFLLTVEEASDYFNISSKRIRAITDDPEAMSCVLFVGRQRLVKRKEMEKFLTSQYEL